MKNFGVERVSQNFFMRRFGFSAANDYLCRQILHALFVIHNNLIPARRFAAINLFGVLFVRKGVWLSAQLLNHERIHTAQMVELLFVGFYLWYVVEWLVLLTKYRNAMAAYRNISFEREAYDNGDNLNYLSGRRHWAWFRWLT